jgi:hypothetical protein
MVHATTNGRLSMFRYKLNENCNTDSKIYGPIKLTKEWKTMPQEEIMLRNYIRTKDNPGGDVDYEEFNVNSGGVIRSSYVNFKKRFPYYKKETLMSFPRHQLVDICKAYSISTEGKRPEFLIEKIIEKQDIYKVADDERKEKEKFDKIEKIIEEKLTKILINMKMSINDNDKEKIKEAVKIEIDEKI